MSVELPIPGVNWGRAPGSRKRQPQEHVGAFIPEGRCRCARRYRVGRGSPSLAEITTALSCEAADGQTASPGRAVPAGHAVGAGPWAACSLRQQVELGRSLRGRQRWAHQTSHSKQAEDSGAVPFQMGHLLSLLTP